MEIPLNSSSISSFPCNHRQVPFYRIKRIDVRSFPASRSISRYKSARIRMNSSSLGDMQRSKSNLESLFCYDKSIPEEIIEKPIGLSLNKRDIGTKPPCIDCQEKGVILCTTCSGSGLYMDSILESQGIIVKVRCLDMLIPESSSGIGVDSGGDEFTPLWKYVEKMEKSSSGGGNWRWKCKYCQKDYLGSYSRVKAHLLQESGQGIRICPSVKSDNRETMKQLHMHAETRKQASKSKPVRLPSSSESSIGGGYVGGSSSGSGSMMTLPPMPKRRRDSHHGIKDAFNNKARDELHAEIARMFYSAGLPFNLARNPHFMSSFAYAARHSLCGYKPPGYNMLRTTLLQNERHHIEKMLEPIKDTWKMKGVSVVSDGWSDAQRRPIINFMSVTESGSMFLKAVNAEGQTKNRQYISNLLEEVIKEVGPQNVVQVITDNVAVCKAAGALIEDKYPHIFWTPCVVHMLNLALKNICAAKNTDINGIAYDECSWITDVSKDAMEIKIFIMNHQMRLSIFNDHSKLKLLSIADTRFASVIIMLKRFKVIKRSFQDMVISEKWSIYREDDFVRAQDVKEKVLDDLWWDKIEYILSFTEPIYEMLRIADTDRPSLHLVYDMWDTMIEKVKGAIYRYEGKRDDQFSSFYKVVYDILVDRWNKSNTPLHCLAHSLNPRYYSKEWLDGNINRVPPNLDNKISIERSKGLRRYFSNIEERRMINNQFAAFSSSSGAFSDSDCLRERGFMDPKDWWVLYGASAPQLQKLALKLLGQPCSSSCCERNWSTYSFIHSLKRNKLTPQRAEDLVFVHTNLRLLSRRSKDYNEGDSKLWDIGGDAFESFEGAGVLEIANLSLDEPEMERVVFEDEGDEMGLGPL